MSEDPGFSASGPYADFGYRDLLACYANGVFPMAETRDDPRVFLIRPEQRGLIPLDQFHVPTRLRRTVRRETFEVRINTAFAQVLEACATSMPGREDTWINAPIHELYLQLFARHHAHSVECWQDGQLVGGVYGVTLGGAFFGESMFSRARDASKVALVHLVARLRRAGWSLLDTQFLTDHLSQFGARETPQAAYLDLLRPALKQVPRLSALRDDLSGDEAVEWATKPVVSGHENRLSGQV